MKDNLMKSRTLWVLVLMAITTLAVAQQPLTQTIRGRMVDTDTKAPLPGATILIMDSDPVIGTTTDMDGYYALPNVPVGKVDVLVRFLGYEEQILPGIVVSSGKEVQLNLELREAFEKMDVVEITPDKRSKEELTEMSLVSSTTFSVEEASRAPGTFHDPARMASTFAGVATDPQGNNDIVVRGNSPKGIQWRLDGIEIPNPNHFADEGATGGAINALNSDMLSNSNFYTGAFAPEFGNAYSGIMDLELRTGNKGKHEFSLTASTFGLEASAEGPFQKGKRGSYLVSYRYSTLTLIDKMGILDFGGVPEYQDGIFKIHLPTKKAGVFSIFGMGAYSKIDQNMEDDNGFVYDKFNFQSFMGVVGVKHAYPINNNTFISTDYSFALNGNINNGEEREDEESPFYGYYKDNMKRYTNAANVSVTHKFSTRHILKSGVGMRVFSFNYVSAWNDEGETVLRTRLNNKGNATLLNAFVSWKYRITRNLSMVSGLHYQHFLMNDAFAIEPRVSARWKFTEKQTLYAGVGLHSKLEPLTNYYSIVYNEAGRAIYPNKDLKLAKAAHFVLGYEYNFFSDFRLKVEMYYQQLFHVPVEDDPNSSFSLLNSTGFFSDVVLVNDGKGKNYGMELTLEKYFTKQYYFTFTASLYESKYTAKDNVERDTRFNGNFSLNAIGGKEFNVGKKERHRLIGITARVTFSGKSHYTPVLLEESRAAGYEIVDKANPYSATGDYFFKLNMGIYYKRDLKRVSHTVKIDVENLTNYKAKISEYYNSRTGKIEDGTQLPLLPEVRYTLNF